MISLAQFCSALRLSAPLGSTHRSTAHCNSPRLSSIATHVATSNGTPRRLVSALPSASRRCSTPRNATPRSAPLLASSRLCSAHLISTQRNAAMLGSGSALFPLNAPHCSAAQLVSAHLDATLHLLLPALYSSGRVSKLRNRCLPIGFGLLIPGEPAKPGRAGNRIEAAMAQAPSTRRWRRSLCCAFCWLS
jgi:hypothetical protein